MADSIQENTDFVWTWLANDEDYYGEAQEMARRSTDVLADFVRETCTSARKDSQPEYVSRYMTPDDWDQVDWDEIASCLLDE